MQCLTFFDIIKIVFMNCYLLTFKFSLDSENDTGVLTKSHLIQNRNIFRTL